MSDPLGQTRLFEFQGKKYNVSPRDIHIENLFSEFAKSEAALELWKLKATAPPDFYTDQQKIYSDKLLGKQFKWGTPTVHPVYWSDEGQRQMLFLKMKRGEAKGGDPIERITIDEITKDAAKWEELLMIMWEQDEKDFFEKLKEELKRRKEQMSPPSQPSTTSSSNPTDSTLTT